MIKKAAKKTATLPLVKHTHPFNLVLSESILGIVLSLGSLFLFAKIAEDVLGKETQALDVALSQSVYALRTPFLTHIMFGLSFMGADFTIIVGLVIIFLLVLKKRRYEAMLFVSVFVIGFVINNILKMLFARPRPDIDPLVIISSYSFPSGHAMNSFIFYSVLAYFVYHFTRKKVLSILVTIVALLLILLIGFSRVYLGVHYPSDVIAGYIAGCFVFVTAILIDKTIRYRYGKKTSKTKNI